MAWIESTNDLATLKDGRHPHPACLDPPFGTLICCGTGASVRQNGGLLGELRSIDMQMP